ncbi:MAG TPA: hypothetical protein IAB70_03060 [Candidatus Merdicola faecigallinarum]|uniref:Uncharacterized protein n=1 Tax=Candidatus Merdicola faecigallinarum TaxID=2840862 RepID=A0A9D1M0Z4_9FIRM|nr:hypothetical protein [Candidatus Merdicola faecigallinarum]
MDLMLNEVGIEVAQEKIAQEVGKLTIEYEKTHDQKIKKSLEALILDRDEIYKGNEEIIRKYVGDSTKWIKEK